MKKENGKGDELMGSNYIRFDWAMKRLLRNKANFACLLYTSDKLQTNHFLILRKLP